MSEPEFAYAVKRANEMPCCDSVYAPSTSEVRGVNWANDEIGRLRAQVSALQTSLTEQQAEFTRLTERYTAECQSVATLQTEVKHWKDQHANEVRRAKILKDTTDLPLERVRAYELMGELQGQMALLEEALKGERIHLEMKDSALAATETLLKAAESERDQLRAEVERRRDGFIEDACNWRGIDIKDACPQCCGSGVRTYGSTSTWQGGIGGQMMTPGVCDMCWGSGDKHRHGANLRKLRTSAEVSTSYEKGAESMRERVKQAVLPLLVRERRWRLEDSECGGVEVQESVDKLITEAEEAIRTLPLKENEG